MIDILTSESKVHILHGPPGTGKTEVLAALIFGFGHKISNYQQSKVNILVCAHSNKAIDQLIVRLHKKYPEIYRKIIRMGEVKDKSNSIINNVS